MPPNSTPHDLADGISALVTAIADAADADDEEEGEEEEQTTSNEVSTPLLECQSDQDSQEQFDLQALIDECPALQANHQSAKRTKSALKHLRFFMPSFYRYKGEADRMVDIEDLVCQGRDSAAMILGQTYTKTGIDPKNKATYNPNARSTQWFNEMIIHFSGYLVKARKWLKVNADCLSYQAAANYLSDVKIWILTKNPHLASSEIPVMDPSRWKAHRKQMLGNIILRCRADGTRVHNGHTPASRQDRKAMALACVWLGTPEGAEFYHLNTSTYHFAGRGSECSLVLKKDTSTRQVTEGHKEYETLHVFLKRHKTHKEQDMSIFAHKQFWHQCFFFSLMYRILTLQDADPYMLPLFAGKANATDGKGQVASKVASHWTTIYKKLLLIYETINLLAISLSAGLSSHSQKKGANQDMSGILSVSGLAQIFRSGWQIRGVHSLLEYVVGDQVMQDQAGKALAGWTTSYGNDVIGGEPPNLEDITTERDQLTEFVNQVFAHDPTNWDQGVKELLVANFIRFYDEFIGDLCLNPNFIRPQAHPVVQLVLDKLAVAKVTPATFDKWKQEINRGFRSRNVAALPLSMLDQRQRTENSIDLRSLAGSLNTFHQFVEDTNSKCNKKDNLSPTVSKITQAHLIQQTANQQNAASDVRQLKVENEALKKKCNKLSRQLDQIQRDQQKSIIVQDDMRAAVATLLSAVLKDSHSESLAHPAQLTPSPKRRRLIQITPDVDGACWFRTFNSESYID